MYSVGIIQCGKTLCILGSVYTVAFSMRAAHLSHSFSISFCMGVWVFV